MFSMAQLSVTGMVTSLVAIVVGIALIPVIQTQLDAANITNASVQAIVSLIPFFFSIGLLVMTIKGML